MGVLVGGSGSSGGGGNGGGGGGGAHYLINHHLQVCFNLHGFPFLTGPRDDADFKARIEHSTGRRSASHSTT